MQRPCGIFLLAFFAIAQADFEQAFGAEPIANSQGEEGAIRAAAKDYFAAKRRGDVEALRKMWTPDGDYVDATGQVFKVQELFREPVATSAANEEPADISVPNSTLRFITPEVAIEDGAVSEMLSDGSEVSGRFTSIWVKRDGRWLLDSLREATSSSSSVHERLQSLEWLLGEWVGKTDDVVILVSSHWSEGGNYIVREFLVRAAGGGAVSGSERIGWDPATDKIKSWTFDSQGASGEGYWRRERDHWIVESTEVMADGAKAATSAVYVPGEEGSFVWEVLSANVAEVNLPTGRVEFKRAVEDE